MEKTTAQHDVVEDTKTSPEIDTVFSDVPPASVSQPTQPDTQTVSKSDAVLTDAPTMVEAQPSHPDESTTSKIDTVFSDAPPETEKQVTISDVQTSSEGRAALLDAVNLSEAPSDINRSALVDPDGEPGERQLEVDSVGDTDSAYAESVYSDLTSITSSIHQGIWENGRRYNAYGKLYAFPNDEAESERLDMQHAMQGHLLGDRLFWAPIPPNPKKVLDLGTGTGIWAIDFADMFEGSEVIGTDLSAIQPSWVPPNCRFEIDDAESDWTWKPNSFDYIHNRNFICAIRDWPGLVKRTYEHVKPGGWVEWQEKCPWFTSDDGTVTDKSYLLQWSKNIFEAAAMFGTPIDTAQNLKQMMEDAGFVDVQEHILKLPCGHWAKDPRLKKVGLFEAINMTEGVGGISLMLFTRMLGWTPEMVEAFLAEVRLEVKNRKIHSYYHYYVVFGRKPEA